MQSMKLFAGLLCVLASTAFAQAWPDKPVKVVLSQPAGSGPDNVARILSDKRRNGPVLSRIQLPISWCSSDDGRCRRVSI